MGIGGDTRGGQRSTLGGPFSCSLIWFQGLNAGHSLAQQALTSRLTSSYFNIYQMFTSRKAAPIKIRNLSSQPQECPLSSVNSCPISQSTIALTSSKWVLPIIEKFTKTKPKVCTFLCVASPAQHCLWNPPVPYLSVAPSFLINDYCCIVKISQWFISSLHLDGFQGWLY